MSGIKVLSYDRELGVTLFIPMQTCALLASGNDWDRPTGKQVADGVQHLIHVERRACQQIVKDAGLLSLIEGLLTEYKKRAQLALSAIAQEATP